MNTWNKHRRDKNYLKWQKPSLGKNVFDVYFDLFSLANVPSANMEGGEVITYTGASHQAAIELFFSFTFGHVVHLYIQSMVHTCIDFLKCLM